MTGVLLIALGLFALGCGSSPADETASVSPSPSPSPTVLSPAQPITSAPSPWLKDGTWAHDLPVYNVMDYGAVGDGVTNDTPAIMSAVAASTTGAG